MEAKTIRRIVSAIVELHARKGALTTTHTEITDGAGVRVATVYKNFPLREAFPPHCTVIMLKIFL
ncbi:MAG TPA: TetR family transcriptional regulator [Noviherbaspirillum sp.]|nr:TetR family transcriptional regulator [Noviherbaspirillum sp.]